MDRFINSIPLGWWYALAIGTFFHPVANLASRVGVANFDAHPIAYTCVIILGTALGLFIAAKPGPLGWDTLRRSETWIYGLLNTAVFAFGVAVMIYLTATETSAVLRISAVMAFVLSVLFLGHRTTWGELICLMVMTLGVVMVLYLSGVHGVAMVELCTLVILSGVAQGAQMLVVERHKTNRVAVSTAQNLRVTAVVMGVTATLMTGLFLLLGWVKSLVQVDIWPLVPTVQDFFNWPAFLVGTFIGVVVRAPSKYCEFYAAKTISAKYLLAVIALQPIFTGFFEMFLDAIGYLPMRELRLTDWVGLLMVSGGSALLAVVGVKNHRSGKSPVRDDGDTVLDSMTQHRVRETLRATLTFTDGNKGRAAKLLGLTLPVMKALLDDRRGTHMTSALAQQIQEKFAQQVAMADPLTRLANRLQFTTALTQKLKGKTGVQVLLIDLNDFKPVNDTHGHAAGDLLLQMVAKRLQTYAPRGSIIARLGGDEFALFSTVAINVRQLQARLAAPYKTKFGNLKISASVGQAHSPKDGKSAEGLLDVADKRMYGQKRRR